MDLKPLHTVLILIVFIAIGGPAAWFTNEGLSTSGPGDLGLDAQGNLYAHFDDKVFTFGPSGSPSEVHDLSHIDATGLWGGLSFFPNGDWLIAPEGPEYDNSLHRCTIATGLSCKHLDIQNLRFSRTFRTYVDQHSRFYLSDSARNQLSAHNSAGHEISAPLSGLRHPGEVKLYGSTLAVADVDHFQMKLLTIDTDSGLWLDDIRSFNTSAEKISDVAINQPVDFIQHDGMWYVLVKDPGMSFARLRRYTLNGEYIDHLPLPENKMIMAIEKLNDSIVLSDFRLKRLLQIGFNGEHKPDLSSKEWQSYNELQQQSGQRKLWIGAGLWIVFGLLLVGGIAMAVVMERRRTLVADTQNEESQMAQTDTKEPSQYDPAITWISHSKHLPRLLTLILVCCLALFFFAFLHTQDCSYRPIAVMLVSISSLMLLIVYPGWRIWTQVRATRLGVRNEWVVATMPDGKFVTSRAFDLRQIRNALLVIDNHKIRLGQPQNRFYNKKEFDENFLPLLQRAKALGGSELLKWRWQYDRKIQVYETIFGVIAVAVLAAFYTWGEAPAKEWVDSFKVSCEERLNKRGSS